MSDIKNEIEEVIKDCLTFGKNTTCYVYKTKNDNEYTGYSLTQEKIINLDEITTQMSLFELLVHLVVTDFEIAKKEINIRNVIVRCIWNLENISIAKLAIKADISIKTLEAWLFAKKIPRLDNLIKFTSIFGISPEIILKLAL